MEVLEEKNVYLEQFSRFERGLAGEPSWLQRLRQTAIDSFAEQGFPTLEHEEWRFTNLAPLLRVPFQPARPATIDGAALPPGIRLVFVNGHYAANLSSVAGLSDGVRVESLAAVLKTQPDLLEPYLGRHAPMEDQPFVALNTAFVQDGALVLVPRGKLVEQPIHLVFVSTPGREPVVCHPRTLILLGSGGSEARIIESYMAAADGVYFTNAVTEVVLADGAVLDHYKLQQESKAAFHIAAMQVQQDRSSNFSNHSLTFGGALVRNDIGAYLGAEGCECVLNGLYTGGDQQLIDNHTRIDHAMPHCASHELYKGILDGKAKGVFNGKIYVHQDAQKTDAKQTNQTLLLSDDATINTKPQLEIYADDVKCTHGATVGNLDTESIFYLRTRGIDLAAARALLTYAFANDVIGRIKIESLRSQLEERLLQTQHLPLDEAVEEAL
jgi:Fe-S cluster assembly protein SufD